MKTAARPELKDPVLRFGKRLRERPERIPLTEMAALFGAGDEVMELVAARGDIVCKREVFTNDGPDLVVPAGKVELEIPSLLRGTWSVTDDGYALRFPMADYTVRACAQVAFFRKCFELSTLTATARDLTLDFGGTLADRRYTF